ncbi:MAG: hypothetical protein ACXU9D_28770 [Xanthobacteraceae bacterium]
MKANIALACEEAASPTMPRPRYIEDTLLLLVVGGFLADPSATDA